jgi:hypothetical protein
MSDRKTPTRFAKVLLRAAPLETDAIKPAPRARHAAITNDLKNWRNYKKWAEKINGTWKEKM